MMGRKTGGRQKGTRNKKTQELVARVTADGDLPLEFLLRVMRNDKEDNKARFEAAKAAAPYVHPRLQAVERKSPPIDLSKLTDQELECLSTIYHRIEGLGG